MGGLGRLFFAAAVSLFVAVAAEAGSTPRGCSVGWSHEIGLGPAASFNGFASVVVDADVGLLEATGKVPVLAIGVQSGSPSTTWLFDGLCWKPIEGAPAGSPESLAFHDPDSAGPQPAELYVFYRGGMNAIHRTTGTSWAISWTAPVGTNTVLHDLLSTSLPDDPPEHRSLVGVGGASNGVPADSPLPIRLTQSDWQSMGTGLSAPNNLLTPGRGWTITEWDPDGVGSQPSSIVIGGYFGYVSGQLIRNVARWTGSSWTGVGVDPNNILSSGSLALVEASLGVGEAPTLFSHQGYSSCPAALVEGSWTYWPTGTACGPEGDSSDATAIWVAASQGIPERLWAGGRVTEDDAPLHYLQKGSDWSGVAGFAGLNNSVIVRGSVILDLGGLRSDPVFVGQFAHTSSSAARGIVAFSDLIGVSVHGMLEPEMNAAVYRVLAGPENRQWAVIRVQEYSPVGASAIVARSPEGNWSRSAFADGIVYDIVANSPLSQGSILAGGAFNRIGGREAAHLATWSEDNGWQPFPAPPLNGPVRDIAVGVGEFDGHIIVAGDFTSDGQKVLKRIARWDGVEWQPFGSGLSDSAYCIELRDEGGQMAVYIGGQFEVAGGHLSPLIAKWKCGQWTPMNAAAAPAPQTEEDRGGSYIDRVLDLEFFDDGSGERLFAAGSFNQLGGVIAERIASWDGAAWSAVGGGLSHPAHALAVMFDGSAERLYVGGEFETAGEFFALHIAAWNGQTWSPVGAGVDGPVYALARQNSDSTPESLLVGGAFDNADGLPSFLVARFDGCPIPPAAFSLQQPANGAMCVGEAPALTWEPAANADTYRVRIAEDPLLAEVLLEQAGLTSNSFDVPSGLLDDATTYFWTVEAFNLGGSIVASPSVSAFTTTIRGDVDGNGQVNFADLNVVVASFNTMVGDTLYIPAADLNLDGRVDFQDLNEVLSSFNQGCP